MTLPIPPARSGMAAPATGPAAPDHLPPATPQSGAPVPQNGARPRENGAPAPENGVLAAPHSSARLPIPAPIARREGGRARRRRSESGALPEVRLRFRLFRTVDLAVVVSVLLL